MPTAYLFIFVLKTSEFWVDWDKSLNKMGITTISKTIKHRYTSICIKSTRFQANSSRCLNSFLQKFTRPIVGLHSRSLFCDWIGCEPSTLLWFYVIAVIVCVYSCHLENRPSWRQCLCILPIGSVSENYLRYRRKKGNDGKEQVKKWTKTLITIHDWFIRSVNHQSLHKYMITIIPKHIKNSKVFPKQRGNNLKKQRNKKTGERTRETPLLANKISTTTHWLDK